MDRGDGEPCSTPDRQNQQSTGIFGLTHFRPKIFWTENVRGRENIVRLVHVHVQFASKISCTAVSVTGVGVGAGDDAGVGDGAVPPVGPHPTLKTRVDAAAANNILFILLIPYLALKIL